MDRVTKDKATEHALFCKFRTTVQDVESNIGRKMTDDQKQSIWNCDALITMHNLVHGFYEVQHNPRDVEEWLLSLENMRRDKPGRPF